ncbi:MAG: hypothetical protein R3E50_16675 [Halioglobus sp.]
MGKLNSGGMANLESSRPQRLTSSNLLPALLALALVLACLFAYGRALDGPLFFDDVPNLTDNVLLQIDGRDFDDWRVASTSSDAGLLHRPVAMFTFAVNYAVSGEFSPVVLKGTNLAIHLLCALLIYCLCLALMATPALAAAGLENPRLIALVAAAFWLLHPLHVSTVLYAIQRMAQLSTLFVLLGLLVFCRYRLRWAREGAPMGELIAAALWLVIIGGMAVLSKENGALLPWLLAVIEVTLFRGMWRGRHSVALNRLGWVALLLPLLAIVLLLLLSPEIILARYSGRDFSLSERLLTEGRVLWQYLGWILLPNVTAMGFFHDDIAASRDLWSPYTTLPALLAWAGVLTLAFLLRKRYPLPLFALLFYLVAHSMESTVIPLELVFEHRNYLPSVSICLLLVIVIFRCVKRIRGLRPGFVVVLVLGILSAQLFVRTHAWTDELTLAQYNVLNHPASPRANFFYGNALFERLARAAVLGLDADEQKTLAVSARNYFARTHELDEASFAGLVMLYQLDTMNFPGLARENDWLDKLAQGAKAKRLNAVDRTAMQVLVDFAGTDAGAADRDRVGLILDQVVARYPRRTDLLALQYQFRASQAGIDKAQLRELLEHAIQLSPNNRTLHAYLIQYHGAEDTAMTYEWIRTWMRLDTGRNELSVIRRIFER